LAQLQYLRRKKPRYYPRSFFLPAYEQLVNPRRSPENRLKIMAKKTDSTTKPAAAVKPAAPTKPAVPDAPATAAVPKPAAAVKPATPTKPAVPDVPATAAVPKPTAPVKRAVKPVAKPAVKTKPTGKSAKAAPAAKRKAPAKKAPPAKPSHTQDDVALRAYFISEKRRAHGLPGDEHQDWIEAERQIIAESGKAKKAKKA
jgi:hypothetical protein